MNILAEGQIIFTRGDAIKIASPKWLWEGFIPRGTLTIVYGQPKAGKTTCVFSLAATVSKGGYWPDGSALRTDISATLFLSSPEEYEGGELVVEDTYGMQTVKLAAGSLVVYPSGSMHQVNPVTQGERLACYMFMQSMVKDLECRRLLFQMDESLIKLRAQYGESHPELIRLTGLYNNLLRKWTEC